MTVKKVKPELNHSLFNYSVADILEELNLQQATLSLWHRNEYLSFDIENKEELSNPEYLELTFVNSLFKSGLSLDSIIHLLSKLEKPYAYNPTKVYFDFIQNEWNHIPEIFELDSDNYYDEFMLLLESIDIDEERENLMAIVDLLTKKLSEEN